MLQPPLEAGWEQGSLTLGRGDTQPGWKGMLSVARSLGLHLLTVPDGPHLLPLLGSRGQAEPLRSRGWQAKGSWGHGPSQQAEAPQLQPPF